MFEWTTSFSWKLCNKIIFACKLQIFIILFCELKSKQVPLIPDLTVFIWPYLSSKMDFLCMSNNNINFCWVIAKNFVAQWDIVNSYLTQPLISDQEQCRVLAPNWNWRNFMSNCNYFSLTVIINNLKPPE